MALHKGFYKSSSGETMNVWTTQQTIQLFFKMSIIIITPPSSRSIHDIALEIFYCDQAGGLTKTDTDMPKPILLEWLVKNYRTFQFLLLL